MEVPEALFTVFSPPTSSAYSSVLSPLCFKPEDVPKDCGSLGEQQRVRKVTLAPANWVSASAGQVTPSLLLGVPTADRIPLSPPTQSSGVVHVFS